MSRYMFDNGHAKLDFLEKWVNGVDEFRKSLEPFTMAIRIEELRSSFGDIGACRKRDCGCRYHVRSLGLWVITQHIAASDGSTAISNLLLVTGNYMRPGCGAYPLRGHNNVQGASDIGAMPNDYPGYQDVADPAIRERFERAGASRCLPCSRREREELLEGAIRQLPPTLRQVVQMNLIDGRSGEEVEWLSGLSAGSFGSQRYRIP